MRFIAAVALLAACQAAYGQTQTPVPPNVKKTAEDNAFLGTLVAFQNNLDAPLAPFGRKMNSWIDPNSEYLREQIVKGNALGSIFYGVGFSTPGIVNAAITGNDGQTSAARSGRKLMQTPDNFGTTAKANVIASILKGYKPNLSPLFAKPNFPPSAFTKAPKPTGTFIPKNDPLLSKQPQGTVVYRKPNLIGEYPYTAATLPKLTDPNNIVPYLNKPDDLPKYSDIPKVEISPVPIADKIYKSPEVYSPKTVYYPTYESPKPYKDDHLFEAAQSRNLLQDVVQAGYAGSVITGGIQIVNGLLHKSPSAGKEDYYTPKSSYYPSKEDSYPAYQSPKPYKDSLFQDQTQTRHLLQGFPQEVVPGRTGYQNTGQKTVQDNALGSLVNKQGSLEDGKLVRQAVLGFQQGQN